MTLPCKAMPIKLIALISLVSLNVSAIISNGALLLFFSHFAQSLVLQLRIRQEYMEPNLVAEREKGRNNIYTTIILPLPHLQFYEISRNQLS